MRAAVLFEKAAERVDLWPDRYAGDMVARQRKRRFLRPAFRFWIIDLVKAAIDAMACIAGDHMDLAYAFDHRVLADRNRQARLFDPAARIGRRWRNTGRVLLLLNGRRNAFDVAIEQARKERIRSCGLGCGWRRHIVLPNFDTDYVLVPRSLCSRVGRHRIAQQASRQFDAFTGHIIGRACPLLGIWRLITEIARVAFFRQQPEYLAPLNHAFAGWQTVRRASHAGNWTGRKVAVLETENLFGRHAFESAAGRAAAGKVVGVDEITAVFLARALNQLTQYAELIENGML